MYVPSMRRCIRALCARWCVDDSLNPPFSVRAAGSSVHLCRAQATPPVWPFFETSASDSTAAICNICLKRILHGQNITRLGTTCLTRHMSTCQAVHWQAYLKDPHQRTKWTSPCSLSAGISNPTIPSVLSETCTERNEGVELGVSQPSTCGQSAISTPTSDCTGKFPCPSCCSAKRSSLPATHMPSG